MELLQLPQNIVILVGHVDGDTLCNLVLLGLLGGLKILLRLKVSNDAFVNGGDFDAASESILMSPSSSFMSGPSILKPRYGVYGSSACNVPNRHFVKLGGDAIGGGNGVAGAGYASVARKVFERGSDGLTNRRGRREGTAAVCHALDVSVWARGVPCFSRESNSNAPGNEVPDTNVDSRKVTVGGCGLVAM